MAWSNCAASSATSPSANRLIAAANVDGVKKIVDHLVRVERVSGMAIAPNDPPVA
jgi:hypothetical protein